MCCAVINDCHRALMLQNFVYCVHDLFYEVNSFNMLLQDLNDMNMGPHPEELLAGVLTLKDTKCSYRVCQLESLE